MKYWRGYLVAGILAVISFALIQFAKTHGVLVDMIYPYISRLISTSLADWSSGVTFCVWQAVLMALTIGGIVTAVLMILLRWNFFQWLGWVLTVISALFLLNTGIYGLNAYAGPLSDDIRLDMDDYTVTELNEATCYFQEKANELATAVRRDTDGNPVFADFEELAQKAGEGFENLTYEQAISVFAGSTVPVKKLAWSALYGKTSGITAPLTGEAAVNPNIPDIALPFAMCKEMAKRMTIAGEDDAMMAAFLACIANESKEFQYSAYCIAYYYCYAALSEIPTSTAKACAAQTDKGVSQKLRNDLDMYEDFFGTPKTQTSSHKDEEEQSSFTRSSTTDLLACWYVQNFITPLHKEEEKVFDPLDPAQVDLSGIVNANEPNA